MDLIAKFHPLRPYPSCISSSPNLIPSSSLPVDDDFSLEQHIQELHKKPDEVAELSIKVKTLTSQLESAQNTISVMESKIELLQHGVKQQTTEEDRVKDLEFKLEHLEASLLPLVSNKTNIIENMAQWDHKMDAYCASMMKGMANQVVNANKYMRTFVKDVMYDLRRARNDVLKDMGLPKVVDPRGNNRDRRGMQDPQLVYDDKESIATALPGKVADKIAQRMAKRFPGLDRLEYQATECQKAIETGEHKEKPLITEPAFDNIGDLLSSDKADFEEALEKWKKQYLSISQ